MAERKEPVVLIVPSGEGVIVQPYGDPPGYTSALNVRVSSGVDATIERRRQANCRNHTTRKCGRH